MATTAQLSATPKTPGGVDPRIIKKFHWIRVVLDFSHTIVLLLSLGLIIFISYDTFKGIPFLTNHHYMRFQFWVCIVFLLDFFIGLIISHDKKYYLKVRWLFFLISIPYLNIVNFTNFHFSETVLFYLRFVPLVRGSYSLAMVLGYISHNRALSLMTQYVAILLMLVYCLSLIFFYEEYEVNPDVKSFWDALYWAAMNTTTVGCYFSAVTPVGKIISVILPTAGMLMLPLFTVVVTSKVQAFDNRRERIDMMMGRIFDDEQAKQTAASDTAPAQDTPDTTTSAVSDTATDKN